jgi:diguanylate cyclase (GGDEF)-like protein
MPDDKYTYFIFVTSSGDKRRIEDANEAGADDYLVKPLAADQLAVRLVVAERITRLHRRLAAQQAQLEVLNRQLFDQARIDPLTRLGSRLKLREDLDLLAGQAGGHAGPVCALMCDVDFFKKYNDTCGHLAGDKVLERVATTLIGGLGPADRGYRFGGEEFLLLLDGVSLQAGCRAAERHRRAVEALDIAHTASTEHRVTISVGVAQWRPGEEPIGAWLKAADSALYQAKSLGRSQVHPQTE